jgi:hypothetical protein
MIRRSSGGGPPGGSLQQVIFDGQVAARRQGIMKATNTETSLALPGALGRKYVPDIGIGSPTSAIEVGRFRQVFCMTRLARGTWVGIVARPARQSTVGPGNVFL